MFIKEVYLSDKARSTIRTRLQEEKKFPDKRGGRPPPGPTSKSALVFGRRKSYVV